MTDNKTPPSLRQQIIEAIEKNDEWTRWSCAAIGSEQRADRLFDEAIMPVLQRAMMAGELLVGRNTKDRVPVQEGIIAWMESVLTHIDFVVKPQEKIISKRKCLDVIYQFGRHAEVAINDAKVHNSRVKQEVH